MKTVLAPAAALVALFGATAAMAAPATYTFDPDHSQVVFQYSHMGFSTSTGIINGVTGTLVLDQESPANSTVVATIPLAGLRSIAEVLDGHLFGPDFLNTDRGTAVATFKSTKVEPEGDKSAKVTGDFTLNGVTKPVTLDVTWNAESALPWDAKTIKTGFSATGGFNGVEFGISKLADFGLGPDFALDIDLEAIKK